MKVVPFCSGYGTHIVVVVFGCDRRFPASRVSTTHA
jgi:hypothetical protein